MSSMSLSKDQSLSDNRRKDSFDDRICNDLSEVILQYLFIDDKFRYELVSKQFQRTIFQRQHELIFVEFLDFDGFNLNKFEVMLKKLPQINCIKHFDPILRDDAPPLEDSQIQSILKNCNNLVEIDLDLRFMSETTQQLLIQKFGSKLVSLTPNSKILPMIGNSFPNIKELKVLDKYMGYPTQLALPVNNLRKLSIDWQNVRPNIGTLLNGFQEFFENNKSLKHLKIKIWETFEDQDFLIHCQQMSQLIDSMKQLISFKFSFLPIKTMTTLLEQISQKCPKIKCLDVVPDCEGREESEETDIKEFMAVLKKFKRLKRLYVWVTEVSLENIDSVLNKSFETGFKELTHLSLVISFIAGHSQPISYEKLLKDFPNYLPNLRYLRVQCNAVIESNELAVTLGQFSRLETLKLYYTGDISIGDSIKSEVLNNCNKIKTIDISDDFNVFTIFDAY